MFTTNGPANISGLHVYLKSGHLLPPWRCERKHLLTSLRSPRARTASFGLARGGHLELPHQSQVSPRTPARGDSDQWRQLGMDGLPPPPPPGFVTRCILIKLKANYIYWDSLCEVVDTSLIIQLTTPAIRSELNIQISMSPKARGWVAAMADQWRQLIMDELYHHHQDSWPCGLLH